MGKRDGRDADAKTEPWKRRKNEERSFIMTWIDYLILGVVAVALGGIIAYLIISKKKGNSGCGCGCKSCPNANACSAKKDE